MGVIWKLINSSINPIMMEIDIPDALQCYQERIRMEAPVIKAKLSQKLLVLSQTPLPHIFGPEKLIKWFRQGNNPGNHVSIWCAPRVV